VLELNELSAWSPFQSQFQCRVDLLDSIVGLGEHTVGVVAPIPKDANNTAPGALINEPRSHSSSRLTTEAQPSLAELQYDSAANILLAHCRAALVIFGFLGLLPYHAQSFLQERSGFLAVRPP